MSKCIVCKITNVALEVKRHPNWTTIWWLNYFMLRLRKRDKKDISKTCDDHRNPLKLNVCLTYAGTILAKANEDPRLLLLAEAAN
jgi:hypothetical protein